MSYKTVLVHVDRSRSAMERYRIAAAIATQQEAHLIGAAVTGISRFVYQSSSVNSFDASLTSHVYAQIDILRARANEALDDFDKVAAANSGSQERRLIEDEAGAGLSMMARYSDLTIIGQTDREDPANGMPDVPQYIIMNSGRPVLIVPHSGRFEKVGSRAMVAWDASVAATRAVANAIPLLKRADMVDVVVLNAEYEGDAHGEQPGADIALYLTRHGIKVNVSRQKTKIDIGNALLSMAADFASDLIVMGCYGHSPFREALVGGVSRTILQSMTVPVLMAH